MIALKHRVAEQLRHMDIHKWIMSEASGDVGEVAYSDWINRYASRFASWMENIPEKCIGCGECVGGSEKECEYPFNERRLVLLNKPHSIWSK